MKVGPARHVPLPKDANRCPGQGDAAWPEEFLLLDGAALFVSN